MFREVYKSANDDIIPDSQLLDKILADSKPKKNRYIKYYRYGSVAAAFFILVGTLAIYPKIKDNLTNDEAVPEIVLNQEVSDTSYTDEVSTQSAEISPTPLAVAETPTETLKPQATEQTKKTTAPSPDEASSPSPTTDDSTQLNTVMPEQENITETTANPVITSDDSEISTESTISSQEDALAPAESSEYAPKTKSSGGGSSSSYARAFAFPDIIPEHIVKACADEVFASDFGEEFLNSTTIKIEYDEEYIITRYNEEISKTVKITNDGKLQKQY